MAWRLDQSVVRGEIDNRQRGRVSGTLWLLGRNDPIQLTLTGNCHRDLAGRLLRFENPKPQPDNRTGLDARQEGAVGDMTASRKLRILDRGHPDSEKLIAREMGWDWLEDALEADERGRIRTREGGKGFVRRYP